MRLMTMCSAVLMSCASVGGGASSLAVAPSSVPACVDPSCERPKATVERPYGLDMLGVRQMIAGFELELGDERARTAAEHQQRVRAEELADHYKQVGEAMQAQAFWEKLGIGTAGAVIGALVAAGVTAAVLR